MTRWKAVAAVVLALLSVAACAFAGLACVSINQPVLLEIGTSTLLNPLRSRGPEQMGERFLRAASSGQCSSDATEELCRYVMKRPLPSTEWHLVNRRDTGDDVRLFYRVGKQRSDRECLICEVHVQRTGAIWKTTGYAVTPGLCNGSLRR